MAQKINVELIDDLDGKPATETVTYGLDGATYEIDLSDRNAAKLRNDLAPYVAVSRRQGRTTRRTTLAPSGPSAKVIREWATAQGMTVPDRGRLPKEVVEAFNAK